MPDSGIRNVRSPAIVDGVVMLYYCFDAGYEIQLSRLEKVLGVEARPSLLSYTRLTPPYIQYRVPPVLVPLGRDTVCLEDREFPVAAVAKVYDFGAITIRLTLSISGTLDDVVNISSILTESPNLRDRAVREFRKIAPEIASAVVRPRTNPEEEMEDYAVFMIRGTEEDSGGEELLNAYGTQLARLLREETNLSKAEIGEALRNPLSYRDNDLTLIDWNATFIMDPGMNFDVPDIIEFAILQLLELRLYDKALDEIIDGAYDTVLETQFRIFPFSGTIKRLIRMNLDTSETIDRLENFLKLIGDLYLAKVYETAARRFYLDRWKSAVRQKLSTAESIYRVSWDRTQTRRMIMLDLSIVILFVIDILLILAEYLRK